MKEMFAEDNLKFWFTRIGVPDNVKEIHASLFLSLAGAALNCSAKAVPSEKYFQFLTDEENVTRLLCRKWYVASLQHIAFTFVDPSRIIADLRPDPRLMERFLRPDSMAEVSSCQGNWLWFTGQMFIVKDDAGEMITAHRFMNKHVAVLDAASRSSKYTNASWSSFNDHSEHCIDF